MGFYEGLFFFIFCFFIDGLASEGFSMLLGMLRALALRLPTHGVPPVLDRIVRPAREAAGALRARRPADG